MLKSSYIEWTGRVGKRLTGFAVLSEKIEGVFSRRELLGSQFQRIDDDVLFLVLAESRQRRVLFSPEERLTRWAERLILGFSK